MKRPSLLSVVAVAALVGVAVVGLSVTARLTRAQIKAEIYRGQLEELAGSYAELTDLYNTAVRRTAVTDLIVQGDDLRVRIRDASGAERIIQTPFDPSGEIYVDFVVVNGRLWLRRVFDRHTPPSEALVIDPSADDPDWGASEASVGKAVYRSLADGVWTVTVTGDGSLGLRRSDGREPVLLTYAPEIRDFEEMERDAEAAQPRVTLSAFLRAMFGFDIDSP